MMRVGSCWQRQRQLQQLARLIAVRQASKYVPYLSPVVRITSEAATGSHEPATFTCGALAYQADGAVTLDQGGNSVLAAVTQSHERLVQSLMDLMVDYRERGTAVNLIPKSFHRREGGERDRETLVARLVDRSLRPLVPSDVAASTQMTVKLLASQARMEPTVQSIEAASAALMVSDISWHGPVAAVRVGVRKALEVASDDEPYELLINPDHKETAECVGVLLYSGVQAGAVMIDFEGAEVDDALSTMPSRCRINLTNLMCLHLFSNLAPQLPLPALKRALRAAHQHIQPSLEAQRELGERAGRTKKPLLREPLALGIMAAAITQGLESVLEVLRMHMLSKRDRIERLNSITDQLEADLLQQFPMAGLRLVDDALEEVLKEALRQLVLSEDTRIDGRDFDEVQAVQAAINLYPELHGNSLFQRGETQVFCTATLGDRDAVKRLDEIEVAVAGLSPQKSFFFDYEFPAYAINKIRVRRGQMRRETGHGSLAERALGRMIDPGYENTVRVTSQVTSSFGSSSMASVCGGSLAMMDAGVPLRAPVAGLSCGLVGYTDEEGQLTKYQLLTDLKGFEDIYGAMDLKMASTQSGVNAIQFDTELRGISLDVLEEAMQRTFDGKQVVLKEMNAAMPATRTDPKACHPMTCTFPIRKSLAGMLIGTGGKTAQMIRNRTGVSLTVNDGTYTITANRRDDIDAAKALIDRILNGEDVEAGNAGPSEHKRSQPPKPQTPKPQPPADFEEGAVYTGRVAERLAFGVVIQPDRKDIRNTAFVHKSRFNGHALPAAGAAIEVQCTGEVDGKARFDLVNPPAPAARSKR